ncbi:hypothetical protein BIV57_03765 [Mangrovactinospora gilvigrisea]|uniref:histidine kinase n=1 Tax=Mangrovactinospora gilvigrisea TaxID=1428644 RepID=A0A1J7CBK5_9ACTN|nr:histidine kinase [Mangrovactinospora gilvigrisea]OIV38896.1 hypothetical protein BIV57_03765 [Mangrovactinospora gilvigrisea]
MEAAGVAARGAELRRAMGWEHRRSLVLDAVLALLSGVEFAAELPMFAQRFGVPVWVSTVLGFLLGASLLVRRRWPVQLVLLSAATSPTSSGYLLGIVALYSLGVYCRDRRMVLGVGGIALAAALVVVFTVDLRQRGGAAAHLPLWQWTVIGLLMTVGGIVTPVLLGLYSGARRRLVAGLQERARALEAQQRLLAERARTEERARIAREMHDVVAHRVSLMVVHARAIEAVAPRDAGRAVESANLMGEIGRQALDELRQILGVLRSDGAAAAPVLADVEALVAESRAAGMDVVLEVRGEPRRMPGDVEGAAYRVVQEALTNVHKHAVGAAVHVAVAYGDGVAVTVVNACPPGAGGALLPSGGNGLRGMRERVEALGGRFAAGATEESGFRVHAAL